jgi:hypothetical protein
MIRNDIELYNVVDVTKAPEGGWHLYRFPKTVRDAFAVPCCADDCSHTSGQVTAGCELRFVCDDADVVLSFNKDTVVETFRGDYPYRTVHASAGQKVRIALRSDAMLDTVRWRGESDRFSPDVWRVSLSNNDSVATLHAVEAHAPIRPPRLDEVPQKRILAYGSSITQGIGTCLSSTSYLATVGRVLGVDVLCKGMGGSCFCQREVADYIADEPWDVATLELGINMVRRFEVSEFERRATYVIERALSRGKPVVLISNFACSFDLPQSPWHERQNEYVRTTERIATALACEHLHYIRGREIVDDLSLLSADLIHPSTYGHTEMGRRIARVLRERFKIL